MVLENPKSYRGEKIVLQPQSISEKLMYSTIRLSIGSSTATGFFYELDTPRKTVIVISNRHFAEQVDNLSKLDFSKSSIIQQTQFLIHLDDGTNKQICENVEWFLHPSEDLAFFVLGQHRTIRQADSARDFSPSQGLKSAGILYVFQAFQTAELVERIRRSA